MQEVFISIGSNIDASKNMEIVRDHLKVFKDISYSSIYSTPAEGFDGEDFLNCVCRFHSTESPHELRRILKTIEKAMGRKVSQKGMSNRVIDLDLILYGSQTIRDMDIPSDDIKNYKFVLEPLAEIAPDNLHPAVNKSFKELFDSIYG